MSALRVWSDGFDTVVARSAEDAVAVTIESLGGAEFYDGAVGDWYAYEDIKTLIIRDENEPGNGLMAMTCAEWVALAGRGHLGSTEY